MQDPKAQGQQPPQQGPPPAHGGAPPQGGQQGPPPSHGGQYPPQQGGYPPQQGPPPSHGGQYPPQQGGYPPQQGPPPSHGGYPPQQGPPPSQGGYPPQQGGYPPQQYGGYGGYPPQGYPQQYGGYPPQGYGQPQTGGFSQLPTQFRPPQGFQQNWYGMYYAQLQPKELEELQKWFKSVDRDNSGKINTDELSRMTLPGQEGAAWKGRPLGPVGAKKLIKLFDNDGDRTLDFYEYAALHQFVNVLQNAFFVGDADKGGTLDNREIYTALQAGGFPIGYYQAIQGYYERYDHTKKGLDFFGFMCLVADIALIRKHFSRVDRDYDGRVSFDEVLEITSVLTESRSRRKQSSAPTSTTTSRPTTTPSRPATTTTTPAKKPAKGKKGQDDCVIS